MIIIGDIQIQNDSAHLFGTRSLFKWLLENYKDEVIIQVGDFWNESRPNNYIENEFIGYLKQFKNGFHILTGNHDIGEISGNSLSHLKHHNNIFIYENLETPIIDGFKCLMIPYNKNMKELYDEISFSGDICFIHGEPAEVSYNQQGLSLKYLETLQIFGHIHQAKKINDKKIIIGCVVPNACNEINNPIIQIDKNGIKYIEHPIWFEYETLEYGQFPKNKNNILNIKNAPSMSSVYETYKDYYIREEGVEIKQSEEFQNINEFIFESNNLTQKFINFIKESAIPESITNCCIKYLNEVGM